MHTIVENICPKNSSRIPTKCQNFYRNILSKLIPNCLLYIFQLLRSNYCKIINKGKFECYIFLTFRHSSEKKMNETWYTHILFNFRTIISFFYQPTKHLPTTYLIYVLIKKDNFWYSFPNIKGVYMYAYEKNQQSILIISKKKIKHL